VSLVEETLAKFRSGKLGLLTKEEMDLLQERHDRECDREANPWVGSCFCCCEECEGYE
jgi:hypothetical protein